MSHGNSEIHRSSRAEWWVVICAGALTLVTGTVGVMIYEHEHHGEAHILGAIYHAVQMLILHTSHFTHGTNWWLEIGRWSGVVTAFAAAAALFGRRFQQECRRLVYRFVSGHVVVCGLGEKGAAAAVALRGPAEGRGIAGWLRWRARKLKYPAAEETCRPVVVLDPHPSPELAGKCEAVGACVIAGDAAEPAVLARARVLSAERVLVLTPSDMTNVRIAESIRAVSLKAGRGPKVRVSIADINLCRVLDEQAANLGAFAPCYFDFFDAEARRYLLKHPLDGAGIAPGDDTRVHVVLLGFGRMGRSTALRAAKMGHFANSKPLRISVVSRDAEMQKGRFLFRHPVFDTDGMRKLCDLQFVPVEAESLAMLAQIKAWAYEKSAQLHVFICIDDDARGAELGHRLRGALKDAPNCRIAVRVRSQRALVPLQTVIGEGLGHFGTIEDTFSDEAAAERELDVVAEAIHESYRKEVGQDAHHSPDPALQPWNNLRYGFRESNRSQADHLSLKLRAIGCEIVGESDPREALLAFLPGEIEALAPCEHARWVAERWLSGWELGPNRDPVKKTSPHLKEWAHLDDAAKDKDLKTVRTIPALVAATMPGVKVVRRKK